MWEAVRIVRYWRRGINQGEQYGVLGQSPTDLRHKRFQNLVSSLVFVNQILLGQSHIHLTSCHVKIRI